MNKSHLISIIVIFDGYSFNLNECIESIQKHSVEKIEILIGVTNNIKSDLFNYKCLESNEKKIQIRFFQNEEQHDLIQTCIQNAEGEFTYIINNTDFIFFDYCKLFLDRIRETDSDIIFSSFEQFFTKDNQSIKCEYLKFFNNKLTLKGKELFVNIIESGMPFFSIYGNFYKSKFLKKHKINIKGNILTFKYYILYLMIKAKRVSYLENTKYYQENSMNLPDIDLFKTGAFCLLILAKYIENKYYFTVPSNINFRFYSALQLCIKNLKDQSRVLYERYISNSNKPLILILSSKGTGTLYGIGNYLRQISSLLNSINQYDVLNIFINDLENKDVEFSLIHNLPSYSFPKLKDSFQAESSQDIKTKYQKGIFFFIASKILNNKKIICHINTFGLTEISHLLKTRLNAKLIFTLHYTSWGISLRGNINELYRILAKPLTPWEFRLKTRYHEERHFLTYYCDRIITVSHHSLTTLKDVYNIPESKAELIFNYVDIKSSSFNKKEYLRKKYGFNAQSKIIIFAGRLEEDKGIFELITAFKYAYKKIDDLHLIIVGSGNYNAVLKEIGPLCKNIHLTGYLHRTELFKFYKLADLGIVPSLHEEFGYVAAEMAMSGLNVIVNEVGGLKEVASFFPHIKSYKFDNTNFTRKLAEAVINECQNNEILKYRRTTPYLLSKKHYTKKMKHIYEEFLI